jgi:hypothetical protein
MDKRNTLVAIVKYHGREMTDTACHEADQQRPGLDHVQMGGTLAKLLMYIMMGHSSGGEINTYSIFYYRERHRLLTSLPQAHSSDDECLVLVWFRRARHTNEKLKHE